MQKVITNHFRSVALAVLMIFLCNFSAFAQLAIKGQVVASDGEPIAGAFIVIKGTDQGTSADGNGKFTITVPHRKSILEVSCLGFATNEVQADPSKTMTVVLQADTQALDEIVVVGYQEVRKGDLTGSVGKVDMGGLLNTPASSFDQTLGGRVAGVVVTSGEGMPGGTMNITIRGNNSLTQDNTPLYIIDGFPVEDPDVAGTVNPSDIESINILKDASATAIYGARGANGIVIITTKKGSVGQMVVKYDGSCGFQQITKTMDMMDAYEFVKLQNEISPADTRRTYLMEYQGRQWTLDDYKGIEQFDWQKNIFRTAWQQSHNVSMSGGTDGVRYNASASYFDQNGIVLNSNYKRFQARMNVVVRRKKLNVSVTSNFSRAIQTGSSTSLYSSSGMNNLFYSVWSYRPVTPPNVPLSTLIDNALDDSVSPTNDYRFNPIKSLQNEYRKGYTNNLQLNGFAEYEFIKGLKLKVSAGFTYDSRTSDQFNNSNTRYGGPTSNDKVNAQTGRQQRLTWLNENLLTYQTSVKKTHYFNAMAGVTLQSSDYEAYSFKTINIPNESLGMAGMNEGTPSTTNSLKSSWSMMSYLASFRYNYKALYYLTFSFRADGSSKFSSKNRYGYFPSASAAWNFYNEPALRKDWLSNGKIRLSWGMTGNNRVGEYDYYAKMDMLKSASGTNSSTAYPFEGNTANVGVAPISLANQDLKWETTDQWDLGLDLGFIDERISLNIDLYQKLTRDLLLSAQLPYSTGYATAMKNVGKVRNRGLEFTLNTVNIKRRGFVWTTNFNISFNRNAVLELTENQEALLSTAYFDNTYNNQPCFIARKGESMGMMYGYIYEGTYKYDDFDKSGDTYVLKPGVAYFSGENNTQPGMPKYRDLNGDGVIDTNDKTVIGRGAPVHTGGFTNDFSYKGIDLSIFFQWSYGNDIMNINRLFFEQTSKRNTNQFASYADRWTADNPDSDIPSSVETSSKNVISSRIIEDGSYLRLKAVTLGYTFPKKLLSKVKISNLRLYLAAQNLWTWTNYSGYDPEVSIRNSPLTPGIDFSAYPRAFTVSMGLNLAF
ncbi:MAG: SusC/RagA family TonB-linked outer membrane protein [Candidatus Cryptobacteroides sp.]